MSPIAELVDAAIAELGLDADEIAARKAFLEFGPDDAQRLRALHERLHAARAVFIDAFYGHLLRFDATRRLIATPAIQARLRHQQGDYFERLTAGDYGPDYVADRLRVGLAHQQVGLAPSWYLGAYCKYLTELLPRVWEETDPAARTAAVQSLLKIVFFDMGLALETYFHADQRSVLALQHYAESVVCSAPVGLLVLSADLKVLSANRFMDRLFDAGHTALVGRPLAELFPEPALTQAAAAVIGTGQARPGLRLRGTADGAQHALRAVLLPFLQGEERPYARYLPAGLDQAALLLVLEDVSEQDALHRTLREIQGREQAILNTVPGSILTLDGDGVIESANPAAQRLFGYDERELIGRTIHDLVDWQTDATPAGTAPAPRTCTTHGRRRDGTDFPADLWTREFLLGPRQLRLVVVRDVSEREHANSRILKLAAALEQSADAVLITDREGVIEYVNPAFERTTGYTPAEAMGKTPRLVRSGQHSAVFYQRLWETLRAGEVFRDVFINRRKDGGLYYEEKTISPVRDAADGAITHFVSTGKDITERIEAEQRLEYLVQHDSLTDLPNRRLLIDRLERAMARAQRHGQGVAVLFLDLDRFKQINDTLGHSAGDRLLCAVAERLAGALRQGDTVARLGGDEFAILLEELERAGDVLPILEKLVETMRQPFGLDGREFFLSFSIGISLYPQDGIDTETLLRNADTAMYRAKAEGRSGYRFYTADMNARALERLDLENKLRRALERDEFVLHYQPKLDLKSNRVIGVEALLRWQCPERGLIPPDAFIPTLEDTGMIVPVGRWVLHEACRQARAWRQAGLPPLSLAVNVSTHQFLRDDVCALVREALATYALPPGELELEITESALMDDVDQVAATIQRLKAQGVRVAIDDFGTGYSSLAYLKRLAIDSLKIDRSFVRDIGEDEDDAAIVAAVVAMAQRLQLTVVAEGVETAAQLEFLRRQGCDEIQGYLLSRPLPAADLAAWLARHAGE